MRKRVPLLGRTRVFPRKKFSTVYNDLGIWQVGDSTWWLSVCRRDGGPSSVWCLFFTDSETSRKQFEVITGKSLLIETIGSLLKYFASAHSDEDRECTFRRRLWLNFRAWNKLIIISWGLLSLVIDAVDKYLCTSNYLINIREKERVKSDTLPCATIN